MNRRRRTGLIHVCCETSAVCYRDLHRRLKISGALIDEIGLCCNGTRTRETSIMVVTSWREHKAHWTYAMECWVGTRRWVSAWAVHCSVIVVRISLHYPNDRAERTDGNKKVPFSFDENNYLCLYYCEVDCVKFQHNYSLQHLSSLRVGKVIHHCIGDKFEIMLRKVAT